MVKELEIKDEDFKKAEGRMVKTTHKKITDTILNAWRESNGFDEATVAFCPKGGTYGTDVIKKILNVVESY
ncbi:MAG: hypothetical protein AB1779_12060 [Candidatus Thermoplasmatota archaeon]